MRRLGEALAGAVKVVKTGRDQIVLRFAAQAAPAHVFLDDVADLVEQVNFHTCILFRAGSVNDGFSEP